ncbi:hypothetical protein, partial [Methylomonas koyamae]|uniref:hypothetical protein n=1 Tax=Methylomonas koyamae TaxID=702114 RepID=UPI000B03C133
MKDFNRPATLDEISDSVGVTKTVIEKRAAKGKWKYTEDQSKGRYKRRLYALKDLPQDISEKISFNRL